MRREENATSWDSFAAWKYHERQDQVIEKPFLRSGQDEKRAFLILMLCLSVLAQHSFAEYYHGPRQTGETVLDELLLGSDKFVVSVGGNGCTAKDSFTVAVKKEKGLTPKSPHYALTITRTKPDECKAIVACLGRSGHGARC